jgi:type II secretory pathway pseudopilin PulG
MKPHLTFLLHLFRLQQWPPKHGDPEDEGLTLVEALVAIVVLTIVLGFIAVPIAITTGSRVQNRQVEQAQQIAQSFTENARIQMSLLQTWTYSGTTPSISSAQPTFSYSPVGTIPNLPTVSYSSVSSVPAPTTNCNVVGPSYSVSCPVSSLFGYNLDRDPIGTPEFYVQVFRVSDTRSASTNEVIGFDMGVRVYSAEAISRLGSLTTTRRSVSLTSGTGDPRQPLAVVYTSIYRSEEGNALVSFNSCDAVDVMGLNSASAISKITSSPTANTTKFSYSLVQNTDGIDRVVSQDPVAGTPVLCGSTINFTY